MKFNKRETNIFACVFVVKSDKYTVILSILGCFSVGLNKRVSLLLKKAAASELCSCASVVLTLVVVELVWLAGLAEG